MPCPWTRWRQEGPVTTAQHRVHAGSLRRLPVGAHVSALRTGSAWSSSVRWMPGRVQGARKHAGTLCQTKGVQYGTWACALLAAQLPACCWQFCPWSVSASG